MKIQTIKTKSCSIVIMKSLKFSAPVLCYLLYISVRIDAKSRVFSPSASSSTTAAK